MNYSTLSLRTGLLLKTGGVEEIRCITRSECSVNVIVIIQVVIYLSKWEVVVLIDLGGLKKIR